MIFKIENHYLTNYKLKKYFSKNLFYKYIY